jgi:DNA-binding GntR family transcriptional regulator
MGRKVDLSNGYEPDEFSPLRNRSTVDAVYETLRRPIASGRLPPGHRLHQADIAQQLGTSRTPVREALARLTAERLVEFLPNRGFFVATMSESRTRAAVETRMLLEPLFARLAAERRPAEPLARMRAAIDDEKRAAGPWVAYEASRAFHLALAQASGNEFFERVADQLWAADLGRPLYQAYVNMAGRDWIARDAKQHERVHRAVVVGDADAAERAIRQHLETARTYMQTVVDLAREPSQPAIEEGAG